MVHTIFRLRNPPGMSHNFRLAGIQAAALFIRTSRERSGTDDKRKYGI